MSRKVLLDKIRPDHVPGEPSTLVSKWKGLLKPSGGGGTVATRLCERLMTANDVEGLSEAKRENKIARLFAQIEWRVRFVKGEKPPSVPKEPKSDNATGVSNNE